MESVAAAIAFFVITSFLSNRFCGILTHAGGLKTDIPNSRSSHKIPTPRGAGLAVIASGLAAFVFAHLSLIHFSKYGIRIPASESISEPIAVACIMTLIICLLGSLEDVKETPASTRFFVEFLAATIFVMTASFWREISPFDISVWLGIPLAVLWLTWCTNFYNFMDGVNGIATAQGIIMCVGFFLLGIEVNNGDLALLAAALCASLIGFLPHNFPNAKIFMGDAGSLPLGFIFGCLTLHLHNTEKLSFWHCLAMFGPFFLDSTITLLFRAARREKIFSAHRSHFYQKLQDITGSHVKTTAIYSILSGLSVVSVLLALRGLPFSLVVSSVVNVSAFVAIHQIHRKWCKT